MSNLKKNDLAFLKKITIIDIAVEKMFKKLANAFNTAYLKNGSEYSLHLPSKIGDGIIEAFSFEGGISMINYRCKFLTDVQLIFKAHSESSLKFLYNLKGNLPHLLEGNLVYETLSPYQRAIIASNKHEGHIIYFSKDKLLQFNCIQIDRSAFNSKMHSELQNICPELHRIFGNINNEKNFYHKGYFSLKIADLLMEMESVEEDDFLKKIFLEGKAYQILSLHLRQYQQDLKTEKNGGKLRSYEVEKIKKIALQIKENISTIKTIPEYATMAGINENKLQMGFQQLYKQTVNQYIQTVRLEKAQELLTSTDDNISEIVDKIGLSSKSYFSRLFKENYHLTPSEYRKQTQINFVPLPDLVSKFN